MSTDRSTQKETDPLAPPTEEWPPMGTPPRPLGPPVRPARLRVELLEPRLAPSAIWTD